MILIKDRHLSTSFCVLTPGPPGKYDTYKGSTHGNHMSFLDERSGKI